MTEKRFTYLNTTGWNKDGFLNTMNGLNEKNKKLQEENQQLKQNNSDLTDVSIRYQDKIALLENENEQLKQIISNYEKAIDKVFDNIVFADKNAIQSLKKQLKEELKE